MKCVHLADRGLIENASKDIGDFAKFDIRSFH
jgi:hypothetical protein